MKLIASAAEDRLQILSEEEGRKELRESVAIAVQKGNANIILAEYHRATSTAARSGRGMAAWAISACCLRHQHHHPMIPAVALHHPHYNHHQHLHPTHNSPVNHPPLSHHWLNLSPHPLPLMLQQWFSP